MMEKYKFKKEIIPYCCSGLAPRNYISKTDWNKIKLLREIENGNSLCEICDCERSSKMHLHESFLIQGNIFKLIGLYYLCDKCHGDVHVGDEGFRGVFGWSYHERKFGPRPERIPGALWGFWETARVDFSLFERYGVNAVAAEKNFYKFEKYNHSYAYVRAVEECVFRSCYLEFLNYLCVGVRGLPTGKECLVMPFERIIRDRAMFGVIREFLRGSFCLVSKVQYAYGGMDHLGLSIRQEFRAEAFKRLNVPLVSRGSKMYA